MNCLVKDTWTKTVYLIFSIMRRGYFYSTVTVKCFIARLYLEKKKQPNFHLITLELCQFYLMCNVYLTENATTKTL